MRIALTLLALVVLSGCEDNRAGSMIFTVMSYNIGDFQEPYSTAGEIADLIYKHGVPDVLLLQDVPWAMQIDHLSQLINLPFYIEGRTLLPYNHLAILSRFPLRNPDAIAFKGDSQRPSAICAATILDDKHTMLCSLHLQSPSKKIQQAQKGNKLKLVELYGIMRNELLRDTPRSRSVEQFLSWLDKKQTDIVVVGGDFNSVQLAKPIQIMSARFQDAFWPSWDYFKGTFTNLDFPIQPRLDYIFHSRRLTSIDTMVIAETAGDHFPVKATLAMPLHE